MIKDIEDKIEDSDLSQEPTQRPILTAINVPAKSPLDKTKQGDLLSVLW